MVNIKYIFPTEYRSPKFEFSSQKRSGDKSKSCSSVSATAIGGARYISKNRGVIAQLPELNPLVQWVSALLSVEVRLRYMTISDFVLLADSNLSRPLAT